jgi:hypothetical protein
MKKDKTSQNWIIPITAVLMALIIGGSIFATQYYKQKSYEKQQQIELEAKEKAKNDEATIESQQKRGLQSCLTNAETDYWAYMKLNGTDKPDGSVYALDKYWEKGDRDKKEAIDNCNEQYRNKSFTGLDTLF